MSWVVENTKARPEPRKAASLSEHRLGSASRNGSEDGSLLSVEKLSLTNRDHKLNVRGDLVYQRATRLQTRGHIVLFNYKLLREKEER